MEKAVTQDHFFDIFPHQTNFFMQYTLRAQP